MGLYMDANTNRCQDRDYCDNMHRCSLPTGHTGGHRLVGAIGNILCAWDDECEW